MSTLHLVVMGVAGCGKSAVGQRIARTLGLPLIEGDAFHPEPNIDKMRRGLPLTDEDRAGWLDQPESGWSMRHGQSMRLWPAPFNGWR